MTDRGLPGADGSPACPFVAFEDERDARADRPDHRHRCFAEAEPAPRALAHQEAYCLSSAFPVCPTFQDWARREAAHAIPGAAEVDAEDAAVAAAAGGGVAAAQVDEDEPDDLWSQARPEPPIEERPRRNPPRDWAAPPPWASGPGAAGGAAAAAAGRGGHDEGSASMVGPAAPPTAWPAATRSVRAGRRGRAPGHVPSLRRRRHRPAIPSSPGW